MTFNEFVQNRKMLNNYVCRSRGKRFFCAGEKQNKMDIPDILVSLDKETLSLWPFK